MQFDGDFFGAPEDYAAGELPFGDELMDVDAELHEPVEESSNDEGSDNETVGFDITQPVLEHERDGHHLEPTRTNPLPGEPIVTPIEDPEHCQGAASGEGTCSQVAPGGITLAQHEQVRSAPVHIVPFDGAGTPTPQQPGQDQSSASGYTSYEQKVDPKARNPYTPFASRMDWEIARWAKLRGSGSTAFTDLLAIPEVRRT